MRPRSKTFVTLDLDNVYARLGISPLTPTDEIKDLVNQRRKELMRKRRTRGQHQFGEEEAEMTALQLIEDKVGSPRSRERYDAANPQNVLLTVQPGPRDRLLDRDHWAGVLSAWAVEELGRDAPLPSPESTWLWVPGGLDPEVAAYLEGFPSEDGGGPPPATHEDDLAPGAAPLASEIDRLLSLGDRRDPRADTQSGTTGREASSDG
jgi:hypothetical protein